MTSNPTPTMPVLIPVPLETRGQPWYVRTRRWLFGRRKWMLAQPFYCQVRGVTVRLPAGFITDFASIPRLFWPVLSPTGILMIPGILHDWYYRHNFFETEEDAGSRPFRLVFVGKGKWFADQVFKEVARQVNGMIVPNLAAWVALDMFGWWAWLKHRKTPKRKIYTAT